MPINWEACPAYNKDKKRYKECPAPILSMCHFSHCDLYSTHKCGDCVHWEGAETRDGKHHTRYGHCYHEIGEVHSYYKCNCPWWFERPDNFPTYSDWIEKNVEKDISINPDMDSRESRKKWYKAWGDRFPKNDWWIDPYKNKEKILTND